MKRLTALIIAVALSVAWFGLESVVAKEKPPAPDKLKKLSFPDFKEFETKNGIEVLVVEHREQPVVTIGMVIKAGDTMDPEGKESLASFTVDLLNKGTESKSALQLAQWIESVGGSVGTASSDDYSSVFITVLSEYVDLAYDYLHDIMLNPSFPEDEIELYRKQYKTGLEFELSDPNAMARRHFSTLVYGDHPYSKQPTVESLESVTRDDIVSFYKRNFVPNNVLLAVVGDVKWKSVRKSIEKRFEGWAVGTPDKVVYAAAPEPEGTKIYLYNKPGAVQTVVRIGHLVPVANHPDWPALVVGNQILGVGFDSRLFQNIREDKGWTYDASSNFVRRLDRGYFVAQSPVRTEVTDSALVEILSELDRLKNEPVSDEDLANAQSFLVGSFPLSIETPEQIATRIVDYKLLGLGKKDLESYRDRLAAVTVEDVSTKMKQHLHPERSTVVMVGDAAAIMEKLEPVAEVALFDIAGAPLTMSAMAVEPANYEYDTSVLADRTAVYALTVQNMALGDVNTTMTKRTVDEREVIEVSSKIDGMFKLDETAQFGSSDLSPVYFKRTMQIGPQTVSSELAFTGGSGSGTVQSMDSPEPREVTFELVEGAIMDVAIEVALSCLVLEAGKTYRFPVVDGEGGTLQTVNVEIMEIVDVETAAGSFSTFKTRIKRADGEYFIYLGTEKPHVLVKQEVPAQQMSLVLKSMSN